MNVGSTIDDEVYNLKSGNAPEASIAIEFDFTLEFLDGATFFRQTIFTNPGDLTVIFLPQKMEDALPYNRSAHVDGTFKFFKTVQTIVDKFWRL